jgi:hypothetical protein
MANLNPVYYPFSVVPATSSSNVYPYDILIQTVYPGLIFDAQEAGGTYAVIREVNGCLWFALNADFDETTLEWTQEDPTNPNTPAYAMEICAAGTWNWYSAVPTLVPGIPVVWRQVFLIDANGAVISTPQTVTFSGDPSQQVNVTWDLGGAAVAVARQIDITNTSSSVNSLLDNMIVNGTQVWAVNEEGVLVAGDIPYARITGAPSPPSFNNPTFTGTATFTGPIIAEDGETITAGGLAVTGGTTTDTLDVTGTSTFVGPVVMDSTLNVAGAADFTDGITVSGMPAIFNNTMTSTAGSTLDGGTTVTGGEAVTGGLTTDTLDVTGTATFHGVVENGAGGPVVGLTSPDGSISVVTVGQSYTIEDSGTGVGSSRFIYTQNITGPTFSSSFLVPGTAGQIWMVMMDSVVATTASITAGTLIITGTGGTDGGLWAGVANTKTNPDSAAIPIMFGGNAHGGDLLTATWTLTGGTIVNVDVQFFAARFT